MALPAWNSTSLPVSVSYSNNALATGTKLFDIGTDQSRGTFIRLVDNTPDFFIDQFRGRFRDILRRATE